MAKSNVEINDTTGEIIIGFVPKRDGSDYSEDLLTPSWAEMLDQLEEYDIEKADIVFIGKIYANFDKISGATIHMGDTDELYKVPQPGELIDSRRNTVTFVQRLMGWEQRPQHITAIVIREIG